MSRIRMRVATHCYDCPWESRNIPITYLPWWFVHAVIDRALTAAWLLHRMRCPSRLGS